MKKYLLVIVIIAVLLFAACTPSQPQQATENNQPVNEANEQPQENNPAEVSNDTQNSDEQPSSNSQETSAPQATPIVPTPEPTQEFIDDDGPALASYGPDHNDLLGLWYLVQWNNVDVASKVIFYDISQYMMNVLPYGSAPANSDFNYSYANGVMDYGEGNYDVVIDQGVLVMTSQDYGYVTVFQPVTESDIPAIVAANDTSHSAGNAQADLEGLIYSSGDSTIEYRDHDSIVAYIMGSTWETYGYVFADGTYSTNYLADEYFNLYDDFSFDYFGALSNSEGLYEIYGTSFEMSFSDGTHSYSSEIYLVYNETECQWYMLRTDNDSGNPSCYLVYKGGMAP